MTRRVPVSILVAVAVIAGCDSGPGGPGSLVARATGPSLGGVILEVEGSGVRGFTARGTTRVYSAPVPGRDRVHRVILIDPEPGDLGFDIEVDDVRMADLAVTVVAATTGDNTGMATSDVAVRVER